MESPGLTVVAVVASLRRAGVDVSPASLVDAVEALAWVAGQHPTVVQAALRSTLLKSTSDRARFDAVWRSLPESVGWETTAHEPPAGLDAPLVQALRGRGLNESAVERILSWLQTEAKGLSSTARGVLGLARTGLGELLELAGYEARLETLHSPQHVGLFVARLHELLGLRTVESELEHLAVELTRAAGADVAPELEPAVRSALRAALAHARRQIRAHVEHRLPPAEGPGAAVAAGAAAPPWESSEAAPQGAEAAAESAATAALLRRLDRSLYRPSSRRRGRLDLAATTRRALATDGVPLRLVRRASPPHPLRLVVLCDVSDSMRGQGGALLAWSHEAQRWVAGTRTFVFVSDVLEVTELFGAQPQERALAMALWQGTSRLGSRSNYLRALRTLVERHPDALSHRTLVLVLGDGRTAARHEVAEQLAALRQQVHRLVWWTPEPRSRWGVGDSGMLQLVPVCHDVQVVSGPGGLRRALERLGARGP
jgi:hypothetical protein